MTQLNQVALGCGLTYGELIQDEEQKKLLLLIHDNPDAEQRVCVTKWAQAQRPPAGVRQHAVPVVIGGWRHIFPLSPAGRGWRAQRVG